MNSGTKLAPVLNMKRTIPSVSPSEKEASKINYHENKVEQSKATIGHLRQLDEDEVLFSKSETKRLRQEHVGPNVAIFFKEDPLMIVRGKGQYLYDENENEYLDCNSNVNHVGHSHPYVAEAVYKQMLTLNVNSRFLNDKHSMYAKRLTSKFPEKLKLCYFANSGSEAIDLAVQMARAYHKGARQKVLCLEMAYHGHLETTMRISDYKKKNGKLPYGFADLGKQDWVKVVPMPDPVRGKFAHIKDEAEQCDAYLKDLAEVIESEKDENGVCSVAAFIAESFPSCAGQIIFPKNYLKRVFELLHKEDILCIADEVQTGFGRIGTHFWAFEMHEVVPDMVSVGKPIANGYPLSALVVTSEVATAFCAGKRTYFNTFGGAPVSMAAGLAVLDVIENEKLQQHALEVGTYLKGKLEELKSKHWMIADVRGQGLFVGFELIRNKDTLEPGTEEADELQMRMMKEERVLINLDGKFNSVIKFKPPMCFSKKDADTVYKAADRILGEIEASLESNEEHAKERGNSS
ncbi:5-phosphohydroxy-L-lysine phospho-lyase-like [Symsagittifera roscoffensis]|uniref:5-phosphohydroxy-L-lysine phospho-lyase-like n=1 Tax=Symsagittifera roscoffensis TaxID=84072 RepID=UPI00307BE748